MEEGSLLIPQSGDLADNVEDLRTGWELEAIESAVKSGFLGVAHTLSARLLEKDLGDPDLERLYNYQLQIALAKGHLEESRALADLMTDKGLTASPLLLAYLSFFEGDDQRVDEMLRNVRNAGLSPGQQAWYTLLEALVLARQG